MPYIGNITQDFNVSNAMLDTDSVTSIKIVDGTIEGADIAANLDLSDNQKIRFGAGNDLQLYHGGTNSIIQNSTGDLYFKNTNNLFIQVNDTEAAIYARPNGAVELYHDNSKKFETTAIGVTISGDLKLPDGEELRLGNSNDIQFYHDGTHSYLENNTGNLRIRNNGTLKTAQFEVDQVDFNDSANTQVRVRINSDGLRLPQDNDKIQLGTGNDLQIYHDGTNSYIANATGGLRLSVAGGSNQVQINKGTVDEQIARFIADGAVELYYDNSKKLSTSSSGIQVEGSGILNGAGTNTTTLTLKNATDTTGTKLGHSSNSDRGFLQVTESGADFGIQVGGANTSNMRLELFGDSTTASRICLGTEEMITAAPNGAVELYYDNAKKVETHASGFKVTGACFVNDGSASGNRFSVGNGGDLKIYHTNPNSYIDDNSSALAISSQRIDLASDDGENMARFYKNAQVELYHNNIKRLQTRSGGGAQDGIVVYGNSSNVAINLFTDTSERGTVYANSSNMVGFLDSGGDWAIRHTNDSQTEFFIATNRKAAIDADGLKFGSDTAAANALDDYEEGTWTPAIGSGSTTISNPRYTKIGNLVHVHFYAQGFTDVSSTTPVSFSGLPYTSASDNIATGNPLIAKISFNENIVAYIGGSTTTVNFFDYGSGDYDHVRHNNINGTDTTHRIFIGITYRAA